MAEISGTIQSISGLIKSLVDTWNEHDKKYDEALKAIMIAVFTTKNYLRELGRTGENPERERELVNLWLDAGIKLRPLDENLAKDCEIKAFYWADTEAQIQGLRKLDDIFEDCKKLIAPEKEKFFNNTEIILLGLT